MKNQIFYFSKISVFFSVGSKYKRWKIPCFFFFFFFLTPSFSVARFAADADHSLDNLPPGTAPASFQQKNEIFKVKVFKIRYFFYRNTVNFVN